jgi:1,4-dihydroxy-2-naphthoyl-CoA hydrolase
MDEATAPGLTGLLGIEVVEIGTDRVVLRLDVDSRHHQPYGIVHGGVHCTLVETAASLGGATWWGDRGGVVGVHYATDFLRAVSRGTLTATATPVHRGRTQQLWAVAVTDDDGRLVARGQVRLANLEQFEGLGRSGAHEPGSAGPPPG